MISSFIAVLWPPGQLVHWRWATDPERCECYRHLRRCRKRRAAECIEGRRHDCKDNSCHLTFKTRVGTLFGRTAEATGLETTLQTILPDIQAAKLEDDATVPYICLSV